MCGNAENNTTQVDDTTDKSLHVPDIFLIMVASIGMLLSGVLLIFGRKNLPKSCSLFICNLAAADLATAFAAFAIGFEKLIASRIFRRIIDITAWCTVLASFLTLLGIALQRYISVVYSIWSHSRMKDLERFYKLIIVGIWLVALSLAPFLHYFSLVTLLIITSFEEIMTIGIIVLYLSIYWSFRNYRIKDKEGIFARNEERLRLSLKKEAKLSVVVCCVTAMLVIGILPNVITVQIMTITLLSGNVQDLSCIKILNDFNSYLMIIEVLSFSLNPLIYFRHNQVINKISNDNYGLKRIRHAISMAREKRVVPQITIMHSRTTEITNAVRSAGRKLSN